MNLDHFIKVDENEKPLDNILENGGFTSILRKIGCIGDSLSSGEMEVYFKEKKKEHLELNGYNAIYLLEDKGYYDMFEYSWGQFIARAAGVEIKNMSAGGMSAKVYMESFGEKKGFFSDEYKLPAYIIAFGVNDILWARNPVGTVDDVDFENIENSKDFFAKHFVKLVQKYKEISPNAKFFFVSMPKECDDKNDLRKDHSDFLNDLTKKIDNSYCIDLYKYHPLIDEEYKKKYYLNGHLNAAGYYFLSLMISSYIDYIIRHNFEDFTDIALVTTPMYKEQY